MEATLTLVFILLGTAIGSFLNVCIDRLPSGKSFVYPPSHCENCQHRLSLIDLIPIFSFLYLRSHCRYCNAPIRWRLLWVEVGTGLLFALTYWYYGLSFEFAIAAIYVCLFVVLGVIDLEHNLILNKIVYPATVLALIINVFFTHSGIFYGVVGGIAGLVLFIIIALISRGGMGWGDVKMAALIGIVTGFPLVLVALILGIVLGGSVAGLLHQKRLRLHRLVGVRAVAPLGGAAPTLRLVLPRSPGRGAPEKRRTQRRVHHRRLFHARAPYTRADLRPDHRRHRRLRDRVRGPGRADRRKVARETPPPQVEENH